MVLNKLFFLKRAFKKRFYIFYNRFKFRVNGVVLGINPKIYNKVYLETRGSTQIMIGDRFICSSDDNYNPLSSNKRASIYVTNNAELIIKNDVGMSSPTIWCASSIKIGNNAHIGANCIIIDTDVHSMDYRHRNFQNEITTDAVSRPIIIEDDVWIGMNCIILKGVTIGAKSVIGAGSIVTKSIPANCTAAGNPCKVLKYI